MPNRPNQTKATARDVLRWLRQKIFTVRNGGVYKGAKELAQRENTRKGMQNGDPRVDLFHENKRASIHVSRLTWMQDKNQTIPKNFEIHHIDENPRNNHPDNLLCVHKYDHPKLHYQEEEIPF